MNTRIKLRRTQSSIANISSKLKEGEPLYSFQDKVLVIGNGDDSSGTSANALPARFIAHTKGIDSNKFFAGGGANNFPSFRALTINDLPDNIPGSKLDSSSLSGFVTIESVRNKGSATQPIYFNSNGVATKCTYKLQADVPAGAVFNYTGGSGIEISGSTINNAGVRSIASGTTNGTISVNTNGTTTNVAVRGLGTAAYRADTYFQLKGNYAAAESSSSSAAASAVKLKTARKLKVALESTTDVTFDGSADVTNIPVSGTLKVANGGTGATSFTNNGVLYKSGSSNIITSAAPASANQIFMSNSSGIPIWNNSSEILNGIDWSNISSWKNTYVWDKFSNPETTKFSLSTQSYSYIYISDEYIDTLYVYQASSITVGYGCIKLNVGENYVPTELTLGSGRVAINRNNYFFVTNTLNPSATVVYFTTTSEPGMNQVLKNTRSGSIYLYYWRSISDDYDVFIYTSSSGSTSFACSTVISNYEAYRWTTELGSISAYQHGISNDLSTLYLNRGSLEDIFMQKRRVPRSCISVNSSTRFTEINFSSLGYIPRVMLLQSYKGPYSPSIIGRHYVTSNPTDILSTENLNAGYYPICQSLDYGTSGGDLESLSVLDNPCWKDNGCWTIVGEDSTFPFQISILS